jgi:hypothetical protein
MEDFLPTDLLIPQPLSNREMDDAYLKLAYQCALPAFETLAAGYHDTEALLAVAFSPLVHTLGRPKKINHPAIKPPTVRCGQSTFPNLAPVQSELPARPSP